MQEQVQLLKELQEIDQDLNKVRQVMQQLEAEEATLGGELDRVQAMVDSLVADLEQLQAERRELNQSLLQEQDNVKKAEGRLPAIKTQKEYVAVLKEIDTAKKVNKDLQDRILEKDREIESLARDQDEKAGTLEALREKVEERRTEMSEAMNEAKAGWEQQNGKKKLLLEKLPLAIRKRYQLLFDRRGGIAIVEARNGACLGCHMHLPPQLFNSLFRSEEIQTCPHCNRMIYVETQI